MKKAIKLSSFPLKINEINQLFDVKYQELEAKFHDSGHNYSKALEFHHEYTELIDKTIFNLSEYYFRQLKMASSDAPGIAAIGGYGRQELAPFSDVDILFTHSGPFTRQIRKFIEQLNSHLWTLGIKLSASARTLEECEKGMAQDPLFLTSLLEKRLIWGPKALYQQLDKSFRRHIANSPPGFFISTKLDERDARHLKVGESRYQLEPNVKEGKGALRDIHTLLWIGNFLYGARQPKDLVKKKVLSAAEAATLQKALHFFWSVRCHLHFLAGRAEDRLSFDNQPRVAELMGYKDKEPNARAEKFMKDYFLLAKEVGHLTRVLCAKIEAQSLSGGATAGARKLVFKDDVEGFPVKGNRLTVAGADIFKKSPAEIVRIFQVSQQKGIDIHPDALRYVRGSLGRLDGDAQAYAVFMEILLEGKRCEQTLRRMNEADVLGALFPAFNNIVAHMQYDMYHAFTADEHTIHAIGMMHQLENGAFAEGAPLATALFPQIHTRRALYTAMFLHDIAKGTGSDHSEAGAKLARRICPQLGLSREETETVVWLVEQHLAMTMVAFKRDLNDPKTIEDFVGIVQSPERLKLLSILTTADIMAVGPERWNNWKSGLLSELYHKSMQTIMGVKAPAAPKQRMGKTGSKTVIKITPKPKQDHTEVVIRTPDRKGLFSLLSGAMAASGASIVEARIFTLTDGIAQDEFRIQNFKGHVYENTAFLTKTIKAALEGKLDLSGEIRERQKGASKKASPFKILPRVIIDNNASNSNTVIEVNGKDRPGFLYDVTSVLSKQGLQISAAKIVTFGSKAVDVFYVRDNFGLKILHPKKLETIENSLKRALEKGL